MVVFSTGTTCTVTVGSLSPFSPEQAIKIRRNAATISVSNVFIIRGVGSLGRTSAGRSCFIWLEAPRQSLQVRDCDPVAYLTVVIGVSRLRKGILRIHNFQHRRFARLIAQIGQAKTFRRHFGGTGQRPWPECWAYLLCPPLPHRKTRVAVQESGVHRPR